MDKDLKQLEQRVLKIEQEIELLKAWLRDVDAALFVTDEEEEPDTSGGPMVMVSF